MLKTGRDRCVSAVGAGEDRNLGHAPVRVIRAACSPARARNEVFVAALLTAVAVLVHPHLAPAREAGIAPSTDGTRLGMLAMTLDRAIPSRPRPLLTPVQSSTVKCSSAESPCCCKYGRMTAHSWACMSKSDCSDRFEGSCVDSFQPGTMSEAGNNHCNK